jgi:hypothetical protein
MRIRLPVADDGFEVTVDGDSATFDFGDGTVITEAVADVLPALEAAAERLAQIRTAAGTTGL